MTRAATLLGMVRSATLHGLAVPLGGVAFLQMDHGSPLPVLAGLLIGVPAWWAAGRRWAPAPMLRLVLLLWALLLAVGVAWHFIRVSPTMLLPYGALFGVALSGSILERQRHGLGRWALGAAVGLLLAPTVLLAEWLPALLGLAAAVAAHRMLPVTDDPLRPAVPWSDGSGRPTPRGARRLWRSPFVLVFLLVSWLLFVPLAERRRGAWRVDLATLEPYAYAIPDLAEGPRVLLSLATAPWVNHHHVQIAYVTVLLLLFGLPFEAKEGTLRTVAVFYVTSFLGGLVAGALLFLLRPLDGPVLEEAWNIVWTGGSAGAFGLMGALAARAPVPWPLLALFVLWEAGVGWFYLRSYTPAFHLTALVVGFVATRWLLPPPAQTGGGARSGTAK